MFTIGDYIKYVAQTPNEFYNDLNQATIDTAWDNTTQIRKIMEENYPFDNTYKEEEVWVSTVADVTTSINKVIGNYISVLFRNNYHKLNHRGQKYIYKTNGEKDDFYLCYDKLNHLSQTANTKLILCNNKLKWIDRDNGALREEPMFIGWEMTSTNNQISKDGIVPERRLVCLVQGNEHTRKIIENQRFILSHNKAFKVTQVDDLNLEHLDETIPTLLTLYIQWCPVLPNDNLAENIANYYDGKYSIEVDRNDIRGENGHKGIISAVVKYNDTEVNTPVLWDSADTSIVIVNEHGRYEIVGDSGSTYIRVSMEGNPDLFKDIPVMITQNDDYEVIIRPESEVNIYQGDSETICVEVQRHGEVIVPDEVIVETYTDGSPNNYALDVIDNCVTVYNLKRSPQPLILKFIVRISGQEIIKEATIKLLGLY